MRFGRTVTRSLRGLMFVIGAIGLLSMLWLGIQRVFKGDTLAALLSSKIVAASTQKALQLVEQHFPELETPFGTLSVNTREGPKGTELTAGCSSCRLFHSLIGEVPLTFPSARVEGVKNGNTFRGTAIAGAVSMPVTATWSATSANATFELPEVALADVYHLVQSIVPEVEHAKLQGTVSGTGSAAWPEMLVVFRAGIKGLRVDGLVDAERYANGEFNYQGKLSNGSPSTLTSGEGTPGWLPYSQFGRYLPDAVLAIEDRGFYNHQGFNPGSTAEAAEDNARLGHVKRGGSTLTQQLAKNLFLSGEKTYSRKLRELLYALELDRELGKQRVLELYLNIVEWAPGVYGGKDAAALYFKKSPNDLLPEEAAWLASILRSPKQGYNRQFKRNRPQQSLIEWVLVRMNSLDESERQAARARSVVFVR